MFLEAIHFGKENPQLVIEMLFRGPTDAAEFPFEYCKDILLSHKAIYSVTQLDPLTPQTREIGVGIDMAMDCSVKQLVDIFAGIIQHSKGLLFFYAPYCFASTGAIGEFRWDRTKSIYQILHKATVLEDIDRDTPPPMHLITTVSARLSDTELRATVYNIMPTEDPNEVLIAPY